MIIPMLGASISASPAPLHRKDKILFGIQSIRDLASKLSLSGVEYDNELDRCTISGILSSYPDMCVHNF